MLQSKKGNFIIALIIAIALWAYVVGEKSPDMTREYRNIPITITNSEILEDEGLAVASVSADQLNVKLSGSRTVISKVDAEDITATLDVSQAMLGLNEIKIHLKIPGSTFVAEQSITEVTVKVEQRVTDTKPVKVKYRGDAAKGMEPSLIAVDPEQVEVAGVESRVSSVAYVAAKVNMSRVGDSESSVSATLVPVDKNGRRVENVTLSQEEAVVSSIMYHTKDVALEVPVKGGSDERYQRTVEAPDTIKVKGDSALLEEVTTITAEEIDISGITEDESIRINPKLPKGITTAGESEKLYLTVTVRSLVEEKTVTLDPSYIGISGVGKGLKAQIVSREITVTLTGPSEKLETVTADSISASSDVTGLGEGTHKVPLKVSSTEKNVQIDDHTSKIEVRITEAR